MRSAERSPSVGEIMAKKRKRGRLMLWVLVLLAFLIWLWFEGWLGMPGRTRSGEGGQTASGGDPGPAAGGKLPVRLTNDSGDPQFDARGAARGSGLSKGTGEGKGNASSGAGDASGKDSTKAAQSAPELGGDLERGRVARLTWLTRIGQAEQAEKLARELLDKSELEKAAARKHLAADGPIADLAHERLEAACTQLSLEDAEAALSILERLDPALVKKAFPAASASLGKASFDGIEALLPLRMDEQREVYSRRGEEFVLRERRASGGFAYVPRAFADLDPRKLREAVIARLTPSAAELGSRLPNNAAKLLATLASAYAASGRPLRALLVRSGKLSLPAALRDRGRAATRSQR